jgi:hypothetical protein
MTEELEQLLKNLRLRRVLEIYDEQLKAADKEDVSYSEFVTRLVRAQWHARQEGALEWRIRRANLPERLSLETFPFARQPGVNRKQIRGFVLWPLAEGAGEWLPLPVCPRSGPVRRDVCVAGRPLHAPVAQTPRPPRRASDRLIWIFKSEAGTVQHFFQADGRALSPAFDHHYNELGI